MIANKYFIQDGIDLSSDFIWLYSRVIDTDDTIVRINRFFDVNETHAKYVRLNDRLMTFTVYANSVKAILFNFWICV